MFLIFARGTSIAGRDSTMRAALSLPVRSERDLLFIEVKDVASKVVGVGSLGTRCGISLLVSGKGDPLFLQFKEARESVLEPYVRAQPVQSIRGNAW